MRRERGTLPGFGLSFGITVTFLTLVVMIPLATVPFRAVSIGWERFAEIVSSPRAVAAIRLSFGCALVAAVFNALFGLLVAWVLERYRFPGRRLLDGLVDLPFALPTAVAGITLTTLYAGNGWLGRPLEAAGIRVAYTSLGVIVALIFVGLPFVVRTVQPVIHDLAVEVEEAAASLGATRGATLRRIVLPQLIPAVLTGFTLAFARGLGEYGSVIFIAGNLPMRSEIVPLLIVIRLEEYDEAGAAALAFVFLVISFLTLLTVNAISWRRLRVIGRT